MSSSEVYTTASAGSLVDGGAVTSVLHWMNITEATVTTIPSSQTEKHYPGSTTKGHDRTDMLSLEITSPVFNSTLSTVVPKPAPDSSQSIIWNLIQNGEAYLGIIAVLFGILFAAVTLVLLYLFLWKKRTRYTRLLGSSEGAQYDYIYKPQASNSVLDDEYENTFVGVSVPLLQEISKV